METDLTLNDSFTKTTDSNENNLMTNTSDKKQNSLQQQLLKKTKKKHHKRKLSSPKQKFQKLQEEQSDITLPMNPDTAISSAFLLNIKTLDNQVRSFNLLDYKDKTIENIMQSIFPDEYANETKKIKFIYNGKLLKQEQSVNDIKFTEDSFIHCVINNKILSEENNEVALPIQPAPPQIDQQYNEQIVGVMNQYNQNNQENDDVVLGSESNQGNSADFVCGFLASYFLFLFGFLLIFCCRFSQKAKRGAMVGLVCRTIYNLFLLSINNSQSS